MTAFNQSLNGGLVFSGKATHFDHRLLPAALSFSGVWTHQISAIIGSALSFTGNTTKRATKGTLVAALALVGAISALRPAHVMALAASLGFVGQNAKRSARSFGGSLSPGAIFARTLHHTLAGMLSFADYLAGVTEHGLHFTAFSATLSFNGQTPRVISRQLVAALSSTSHLSRMMLEDFVAVLSFSGRSLHTIAHRLVAVLATVGTLITQKSRIFIAALNGALSFAGATIHAGRHLLTGSLNTTGVVNRGVRHALSSTLSLVGQVNTPFILHYLRSNLGFSGTIQRATARSFKPNLSFIGSIPKRTIRALRGVVTSIGLRITTAITGPPVPSPIAPPPIPIVLMVPTSPLAYLVYYEDGFLIQMADPPALILEEEPAVLPANPNTRMK